MLARSSLALLAFVVALAARPPASAAHSDIPESDVACTGAALLNDDLAPRATTSGDATASGHRVVSARAEILDSNGTPVGTFYLDDRGDRYVAFEAGTEPGVVADFHTTGAPPADGSEAPRPLARDFVLADRYRLAACR